MSDNPDGPWQCRRCSHINPVMASYCVKCSAPRGPRISLGWMAAVAAVLIVLSMTIFAAFVLR